MASSVVKFQVNHLKVINICTNIETFTVTSYFLIGFKADPCLMLSMGLRILRLESSWALGEHILIILLNELSQKTTPNDILTISTNQLITWPTSEMILWRPRTGQRGENERHWNVHLALPGVPTSHPSPQGPVIHVEEERKGREWRGWIMSRDRVFQTRQSRCTYNPTAVPTACTRPAQAKSDRMPACRRGSGHRVPP